MRNALPNGLTIASQESHRRKKKKNTYSNDRCLESQFAKQKTKKHAALSSKVIQKGNNLQTQKNLRSLQTKI